MTYLTGLTRKKRAPQKVKPKPTKAGTWDSYKMESNRDRMPGTRNSTAIFIETALPNPLDFNQ